VLLEERFGLQISTGLLEMARDLQDFTPPLLARM
jgi:hypothetical protein